MDDYTKRMVARAQARRNKLDSQLSENGLERTPAVSESEPNIPTYSEKDLRDNSKVKRKEIVSDSNLELKPSIVDDLSVLRERNIVEMSPRRSQANRTTRVTSDIPATPEATHKTLNIQKENFNMEIKLTTQDDVRVEVEIQEEHDEEDPRKPQINNPLRQDVKSRLQRLGKLYAGGNDPDDINLLSSPIQKTEEKFDQELENECPVELKAEDEARRKRLAALAKTRNNWEDENSTKPKNPPKQKNFGKKSPAPQPPVAMTVQPQTASSTAAIKWDKSVLDSLESQGFSRTESSSKLVYNYPRSPTKSTTSSSSSSSPLKKSPSKNILSKAAIYESPSSKKDPALLSVIERKALFEKNKGEALIPKAAFGMAVPTKNLTSKPSESAPLKKLPDPVPEPAVVPTISKNVDENSGIANRLKALLHQATTISETQIVKAREQEKQRELEMLKNRFKKPQVLQKETAKSSSEEDEPSEDEDKDEPTETTKMIQQKKKIVQFRKSPPVAPPPPPPPGAIPGSSKAKVKKSLNKKRSSSEGNPLVLSTIEDVKRIKVVEPKEGRVYPCLSDIEATTANEEEDTTDENIGTNSSNCESDYDSDTNMADTSFGREILKAVEANQSRTNNIKRPILDDSTCSSDLSDVLNDMNNYLEEQGCDESSNDNEGPSPNKSLRHCSPSKSELSRSFHYKTPSKGNRKSSEYSPKSKQTSKPKEHLPSHILDGESAVPLLHTVSFYRKQQSQEQKTPVRQVQYPISSDIAAESKESTKKSKALVYDEQKLIDEKIQQLTDEICKQQTVISQTSQALNLCCSTIEFAGSSEQVEAERLLLLATQRRMAAKNEMDRLRIERQLRPATKKDNLTDIESCSITMSDLVLPLKREYVRALKSAGGLGHHIICLVKCGEHVLTSQLVATGNPPNPPQATVHIPGSIKLDHVYPDFTVTLEVYSMQAHEEHLPHEVKYHIGNKKKATPKKSKMTKTAIQSPAGPNAVRKSSFSMIGYVVFSLREVKRTQWTLNNVPFSSPLDGNIQMNVQCQLAVKVEMRGFLTMFEDISGFGAWHRRWCLLKGHQISYWKYPDDERKKAPIGSISLEGCVTQEVGLVSRDVCARLNTFQLEFVRPRQTGDANSLTMTLNGDKTTIRQLLSADTKEERIEWCQELNKALNYLNSWISK